MRVLVFTILILSVSSLLNGAPQLVHHPNGEVIPFDPANAAAIVPHLATNGYDYHGHGYGYPYVYGKRSAEAEAEPKHLSALPDVYAVPSLVAHPNGAIVPAEPADVVKAKAEHLTDVAAEI